MREITQTNTEREAEREAWRATTAPTATELKDLAMRLRKLAKIIFQDGGKTDSATRTLVAQMLKEGYVQVWHTRANALQDAEQKRLSKSIAILLSEIVQKSANAPCERLESLATDVDELVVKIDPQSAKIVDDGESKPTFVLGDHPQITIDIDGTATAISLVYEQAVYVKSLIEQSMMDDPWLSDADFKETHQDLGENARPDRWRKKLPPTIKARIKTTSRGSRWVGKSSP